MDWCPRCEGNLVKDSFGMCDFCMMIGSYHFYEIFEPDKELTKIECERSEKELEEFKKTLTNRDVFILSLWYWYSLPEKEVEECCII